MPVQTDLPPTTVDETVCRYLLDWVKQSPSKYDFPDALELRDVGHADRGRPRREHSCLHCAALVTRLGIRWNPACAILYIADPQKLPVKGRLTLKLIPA